MGVITCLISAFQLVWDGLYRCFYWLCCCGACKVKDNDDSDEEDKKDEEVKDIIEVEETDN